MLADFRVLALDSVGVSADTGGMATNAFRSSRRRTNELIEAVESGILSWEAIARAALCYLSEDDVADMAHLNDLLADDDADGEGEE